MKTLKHLSIILLGLFGVMPTGYVCAEQEQINLYKESKFALGIGTAIVTDRHND